MLNALLSDLGARLGIDNLALQPNGSCQLIIDEAVDIVIEAIPGEDAVYVYSTVAQVPEGDPGPLYGRLLQAHLFGAETGDAYFGVSPDQEIFLVKRLGLAGLNGDAFQAQLQEFLNWTLTWQQQLGDGESATNSGGLDPLMRV